MKLYQDRAKKAFSITTPNTVFLNKLGMEAYEAFQEYLTKFVGATPAMRPATQNQIEQFLAYHLVTYRSDLTLGELQVAIGSVIKPMLVNMTCSEDVSEFQRAFLELMRAVAYLSDMPGSTNAEATPKGPLFAPFKPVRPQAPVPEKSKLDVVKQVIDLTLFAPDIAANISAELFNGIKYHLERVAVASDGVAHDEAIKGLVYFIVKHLTKKYQQDVETLSVTVHSALHASLLRFRVAHDYTATQQAYRELISILAHLATGPHAGSRTQDLELFTLAGKYGKHAYLPGEGASSNKSNLDHVVFNKAQLAAFLDAVKVLNQKREDPMACLDLDMSYDQMQGQPSANEILLMQENLELRRRLDSLEAARIAYANEFPLTEDGEPNVGSIHANIRKLKAQQK